MSTESTPVGSSVRSPQLSVVIVSWNVRELLRANLRRLFSLTDTVTREVFVVDNDSHDGTAEMVRAEFPQVHLITNAWDAGFAGPNNQALRLARGEVVLLLNPDMLVEPGALDATYRILTNDTGIGVMGIRLIGQDGQPIGSVRRDPDFLSQLMILLKLPHLFPQINQRYLYSDFDYSRTQDVEHVRGSFFAFRRALLQTVGYLDERYHLWFEEVDYCKRARVAGLRIRYVAEVSAHDYVGKGFAQMKHLEKQRIFTASMLLFFRKWHSSWQYAVLAILRPFALCASALLDVRDAVRSHYL